MAGQGSLIIVGTGIRFGLQTTQEANDRIEHADKVFYLVSDPVSAGWIEDLNPSAESLEGFYAPGKPRAETYRGMVEVILAWVRKGLEVCVALYGHPGVFAEPGHKAIRRASEEGFETRMLPAVTAEDCLFADLGVDPGDGCQSYEATDFLVFPPAIDTRVSLVLWQVAAIGPRIGRTEPHRAGLATLAERLVELYGSDHEVILYEAPSYPIGGPWILPVRLRDLGSAELRPMATLYVPPRGARQPDDVMLHQLGMSVDDRY